MVVVFSGLKEPDQTYSHVKELECIRGLWVIENYDGTIDFEESADWLRVRCFP